MYEPKLEQGLGFREPLMITKPFPLARRLEVNFQAVYGVVPRPPKSFTHF